MTSRYDLFLLFLSYLQSVPENNQITKYDIMIAERGTNKLSKSPIGNDSTMVEIRTIERISSHFLLIP